MRALWPYKYRTVLQSVKEEPAIQLLVVFIFEQKTLDETAEWLKKAGLELMMGGHLYTPKPLRAH